MNCRLFFPLTLEDLWTEAKTRTIKGSEFENSDPEGRMPKHWLASICQ